MKMICDRTFELLRSIYVQVVHELLDDPDEQFTGWTHKEFADYFDTLVVAGKDCELDFWAIAEVEGSGFEIDRLKTMLRTAKHSDFLDYESKR
jgi:hypothetical protein